MNRGEILEKQIELLMKVNEELRKMLPMHPEIAALIRENAMAINDLIQYV